MPSAYPIPGDVLEEEKIMGLSYDQLLIAGAIPVTLLGLSTSLDFVPLWFSGLLSVGSLLAVLVIVLKTPEGQDPFEWAGASLRRTFSPSERHIGPDAGRRQEPTYIDVVHTGENLGEYSPAVRTYLDEGTPVPVSEGVVDADEYERITN